MIGWLVAAVGLNELAEVIDARGKGPLWEITYDRHGRYWLEDCRTGRLSQHPTEEAAYKAARKIKF